MSSFIIDPYLLEVITPPPSGDVVFQLSPSGADGSTTFTDVSPALHGNSTNNGVPQIDTDIPFGGNPTILMAGNAAIGWDHHDDFTLSDTAGDPWCIEAAVRFLNTSSDQFIVAKWSGSGDSSYVLYKDGSGNLAFAYELEGSPSTVFIQWSWTGLSTGVWYEVAANYDGDKIRVFLDGVMKVSSTVGAIELDHTPPTRLTVGCNTNLNSFLLNASVGRVRITKGGDRGYDDGGYTPDAAGYYV